MAILMVNPDGTSNAKAGDFVVTGGGIYRKNEDGSSTKVSGIDTASGTSKNFADVVSTFNKLTGGSNQTQPVNKTAQDGKIQESFKVDAVDGNGIAKVTVQGYDPEEYQVTYKTAGSSAGIGNILGYVILGLVGIALLDRFMNGGGKRG